MSFSQRSTRPVFYCRAWSILSTQLLYVGVDSIRLYMLRYYSIYPTIHGCSKSLWTYLRHVADSFPGNSDSRISGHSSEYEKLSSVLLVHVLQSDQAGQQGRLATTAGAKETVTEIGILFLLLSWIQWGTEIWTIMEKRGWVTNGPDFEWDLISESPTILNPDKWPPFCNKPFEI